MNKLLSLTFMAAVGAAVAYTTPLASQDIVVSPTDGEIAGFVQTVSRELDGHLARVNLPAMSNPHGIVRVRFDVDPDGRPDRRRWRVPCRA